MLADEPITLAPRIDGNPSLYWRGTARVGSGWLAKFAWSEEAAVGVERELRVLTALPAVCAGVPVPDVVHASFDPLLFVSRYVEGAPAGYEPEGSRKSSRAPEQLADALAALHTRRVRETLIGYGISFGTTQPQASTDMLRHRFAGPIVQGDRAQLTLGWCDWVDQMLEDDIEPVVLHGDLHGHNMVLDHGSSDLLLVADFENCAIGDPHYDFRYLPSLHPDLGWFRRIIARYEETSGRIVSLDRVLAWHIRTALGDALWRTELGVSLPHDLTPEEYVDDIDWRMNALKVSTA